MTNRSELPSNIQRLIEIHSYKRPHRGDAVHEFVDRMLLGEYAGAYVIVDDTDKSPLAVVITTSLESRTLFSAHVDTVHRTDGRQRVVYDHDLLLMSKSQNPDENDKECLGADDGAGIWLLLEMIDAGVPGTYVFHYGEEVGGIGSSAMAKSCTTWLETFDRAIAFDRKGTDDVITHQGWSRCCSDDFAQAVATQLNSAGASLSMRPDDGGIFTDTANYTKLIPECTNISCGYEGAHTNGESLDVDFLLRLRDACIQVDWESLPTVRDVNEVDTHGRYNDFLWRSPIWGTSRMDSFEDWPDSKDDGPAWEKYSSKKRNRSRAWEMPQSAEDLIGMTTDQITEWVKVESARSIAYLVGDLIDRLTYAEDELYFASTQNDDEGDNDYIGGAQ